MAETLGATHAEQEYARRHDVLVAATQAGLAVREVGQTYPDDSAERIAATHFSLTLLRNISQGVTHGTDSQLTLAIPDFQPLSPDPNNNGIVDTLLKEGARAMEAQKGTFGPGIQSVIYQEATIPGMFIETTTPKPIGDNIGKPRQRLVGSMQLLPTGK